MIKKIFADFRFFFFIQFMVIFLFFFEPALSKLAWLNSLNFSVEVIKILPPILLILGLLDTWVPRTAIDKHLGQSSGAAGWFKAILLGSSAAGPLFTAFPIAISLSKKGARTSNVVIFLGSWATIKLPMLMMESHFLGFKFSFLRLVLTLPLVILIGIIMEKISPLNNS